MSALRLPCLTLAALLILVGTVAAQPATYEPPTKADIAIGNTHFFDILTPAAGYTVDQRQKLVNGRLIDIFEAGRPGPVTVVWIRGKPTIFVNGIKLITVYPRDAEVVGAPCVQSLAAKWAKSVAEGLPRVWPGCRFPTQPAAAKPEVVRTTSPAPDVPVATSGK